MKLVKNDLFDYGLSIYQDDDYFKFSLDSVLLAEFVNVKENSTIVDFCTGNGVVPLILSGNNVNIIGIEIQRNIAELAEKSIVLNDIKNIQIFNKDVKDIRSYVKNESVDIVTCNPPYFKLTDNSAINENVGMAIARHEIEINLEQLIKSAKFVLKNKGVMYLVHRPVRIDEIIYLYKHNGFSIKNLQFVYTNKNDATFVLVEAVKNGNTEVRVKKPVFVDRSQSYKGIFK